MIGITISNVWSFTHIINEVIKAVFVEHPLALPGSTKHQYSEALKDVKLVPFNKHTWQFLVKYCLGLRITLLLG